MGHLSSLLHYFKSTFPLSSNAEVAIEAAPASVLTDNGVPQAPHITTPSTYLRELRAAGFTRLSLGAQSLEQKELVRIGRGKEIGMAER
jgi:coproporphyrinogen III oxidase-like Fe-S oxidoreductase